MAKRAIITKTAVEALKPGQVLNDDNPTGFVARCLPSGRISFGFRYRHAGQSHWIGLGLLGKITVDQARTLAKKRSGEVADSRNPIAERETAVAEAAKAKLADVNTVNAILDAFVKRHASKLRSASQIEHALDSYVRPEIGEKSIYDVRRSEIVALLDKVEDSAGPVMADRVLAHVRKAFNWQAARDDEFKSPIVRGMARTKPKQRQRTRILADDEIRDIWSALGSATLPACYPPFVKSLLLCATRRNESAYMNSAEIDGDLWTIPGDRYKNKLDHVIPITPAAKALIGAKPDGFKGNAWFIFSTTDGKKGFSGFSKAKRELDLAIAKIRKAEGRDKMARWTLHDLRRTARSLMSRAKVPADYAERCLGHVIGGVREVYDRFEYVDEKRAAFEALAGLVVLILKPPPDNGVPLDVAGASKA